MSNIKSVAVERRATGMTHTEYLSFLRQRKYRKVGQGAFATVHMDPTRHHVIKVGRHRDNHSYLDFVGFARGNPDNVWLPRVYDAGLYTTQGNSKSESFFAVAMEVLKPVTSRQFNSISEPLERPNDFVKLQKAGLLSFNDPAFAVVLNMLNRLSRKGHELDLHSGNVMLRGKQPVVTDPVVD